MSQTNIISLLLYFDDQSEKIDFFFDDLNRVLEHKNLQCELIIIDNSKSNEESLVKNIKKYNSQKFLFIKMKDGESEDAAIRCGLEYAIGDYVVEIPQKYISNELEFIFENLDFNYDVISFVKKTDRIHKKFSYWIFKSMTQSHISLQSSRFNVLSRRAINRFLTTEESIINRRVLYTEIGLRQKNVVLPNFTNSKKSISTNDLIDTFIFYTPIGIKTASALVIFFLLLTLSAIIYSLTFYFLGKAIEGWTTLIILISSVSTGIFILLYLILKYLYFITKILNKNKKLIEDKVEQF